MRLSKDPDEAIAQITDPNISRSGLDPVSSGVSGKDRDVFSIDAFKAKRVYKALDAIDDPQIVDWALWTNAVLSESDERKYRNRVGESLISVLGGYDFFNFDDIARAHNMVFMIMQGRRPGKSMPNLTDMARNMSMDKRNLYGDKKWAKVFGRLKYVVDGWDRRAREEISKVI